MAMLNNQRVISNNPGRLYPPIFSDFSGSTGLWMAQLTVFNMPAVESESPPFFGFKLKKKTLENQAPTKHDINFEHVFFSCMDIPKMDGVPKTNIISKWAELYNLLQPYYLQLVIVDHSPKSQNIQIRKPHCRNASTSKDTFHQVAKIFVPIIYEGRVEPHRMSLICRSAREVATCHAGKSWRSVGQLQVVAGWPKKMWDPQLKPITLW